MESIEALLALGSNLGDRQQILEQAVTRIGEHPRILPLAVSQWYPTQPVGGPAGQEPFLNGACRIRTDLDLLALWQFLRTVEASAGRQRRQRWGARTLDIDILLFGSNEFQDQELEVPHPRMSFRRFVLQGAAEIAGDMVHPTTGWSVGRLYRHLDESPCWLAVEAAEPIADATLHEVARRTGGVLFSARQRLESRDTLGARKLGQGQPSAEAATGPSGEARLEFADPLSGTRASARHPQLSQLMQASSGAESKWVITDFWPETFGLDVAWRAEDEMRAAWNETGLLGASSAMPRLRVLLGGTGEAAADRVWDLRWLARLPDRGPWLELATSSGEDVVRELVAAIEAMTAGGEAN